MSSDRSTGWVVHIMASQWFRSGTAQTLEELMCIARTAARVDRLSCHCAADHRRAVCCASQHACKEARPNAPGRTTSPKRLKM